MGRPRQYESPAARQRAFRQRREAEWPRVNGEALGRLHEQMLRLQAAVGAAAEAGDETARACRAASVETVLERVIQQFEARAAARKEQAVGSPPS
jgi:hypothetical protein